jgi:hypothetical protein
MTAFDPYTYQPGDAWTSTEFFGRALTLPRVTATFSAGGQTTTPSYFEFRDGRIQDRPGVSVYIRKVGSGAISITLEDSRDNGVNWVTVKTYNNEGIDEIEVDTPRMLRLKCISLGASTTAEVKLSQAM